MKWNVQRFWKHTYTFLIMHKAIVSYIQKKKSSSVFVSVLLISLLHMLSITHEYDELIAKL